MRCRLRETTSVIVAVQGAALAVGDADRGPARVLRERGHVGTFECGAPAVPELAGSPAGEGLSHRRRIEAGLELAVESCRDEVPRPGADVDVSFIAQARESLAELGFDADLEHVRTQHDMTP